MTPSWILDTFAAIMLAVAAVSAARLVVARPWQQGTQALLADTDIAHLLMAIAMAGMLTASLQTLPNNAWAVVFAVLTAWFAYRVIRDAQVSGVRALAGGHCAPHLIHAAAMLYMFLALMAPAAHGSGGMAAMAGGMSGMGTLQLPFLAFVFALLLIGYSIWDLDQLSGPGASGHYSLTTARMAPAVAVLVGAGGGPGAAAVSVSAGSSGGRAVATDAQPVNASTPTGHADRGVLAPWVATTCRIAMGATMAFMLLIMI
ncbi:MAG TPA: DUF5134 domain-containing protein [Streptosporangiaceae bacterium]|nr:DUF5134 domain-containing protein [Streptosporangiaceae bacterium]